MQHSDQKRITIKTTNGKNQTHKQEKTFPLTWEPTTSNKFDCLNAEDESKHDLDSNDPIQIQLTNIKLKRKI